LESQSTPFAESGIDGDQSGLDTPGKSRFRR
jgi:hypothetical protein